jgi:hypothetical protein
MTALTRSQEKFTEDKEQKTALDHVLHIVLGLLDTDPLVKAIKLDGCEYMQHFIRMQVEDIACLQYINDDGLKMTIPTWYQEYMRIFKKYCYHKHQTTTPLNDNWLYLTKNDFDLWTKQYYPSFKRPEPSLLNCPSSTQEGTNLQYNKDALHYILENVLDLDCDSQITKTVISLGITTVPELLLITIEDITNLQYSHGDRDVHKTLYSVTIDCFQGYMLHREESNNPVGQSWFSITVKDIDKYVMTDHYCS